MKIKVLKKLTKKRELSNGIVHTDGNNGGDILEIEDVGDGAIRLMSGSCCVTSIDAIVPVEFLTAILSDKMLSHNNDIYSIIDSFGWDRGYKDKLKAKVQNHY